MADRPWRAAIAIVVSAGVLGCGQSDRSANPTLAPALRDAASQGRFSDRTLTEASGLVQSSREPNVFWSHNDSGNSEQLFAFDSTGLSLGTVRVEGARNRDWEAIALGPCTVGSCFYIGDVGDNAGRRDDITLWRISQPTVHDTVTSLAERLRIRYADGPRDVEAIWVTPDTSVYLLTKRPDQDATGRYRPARIYRVPASAWRDESVAIAVVIDSLPIVNMPGDSRGWITDAALSAPDGTGARRLAVRSYRELYVFGIDTVSWRPTGVIEKCSLTALREKNSGEGVAWLADGRLMFDAEGEGARLHTGRCP
ncbi:MAG: hypothetical protein IPP90_08390 [Gemmatimonadaceae bacterium]|nr:hypothetical protein [Gemmatimonadaceae bacterium]